jgi:hypothetical protein
MFAQINYKQTVGSSKLTIAEIGCFLVSNANILEKVGVHIDPPTLNTFYTQKKLYTYDLTDRANDDITWSTVTKYCPQLVVNQIGSSGFPNSDLAIVEFRYVNHVGLEITHFCAVNHAGDQSIIDSWDGHVKLPNEYVHSYGQPIAWATFTFHTPQTTPTAPVAAPISAPAAHTSTAVPQPVPQAPKKLYLPPSVWIWHIYKSEGPYTLPYALKNTLNPKMFGGLTYDILGNPAPHIYLIKTQNFGVVAIYAGPDTVAQFPGGGHGEGESTGVPAPASAPAIVYTRFPEPMQLVTKPGAHAINFESGTTVKDFEPDTPFVAVGKATLPDNVTYFMDDNSFGIADQTQRTPIMVGIQTADLSTASKQASFTTSPSTVITSSTTSSPLKSINPAVSWQKTFEPIIKGDSRENPTPVDYTVINDMDVYDFATGNDVRHVKAGTPVSVVGTFIFNEHHYYLAGSSFKNHTWYGFPIVYPAPSLVKNTAKNTPFDTNDDINQLDHEIETISKAKQAAIKTAASADGFFARFKLKKGNS